MFRLVGFDLVRLLALQRQHIELHRNGLTHHPIREGGMAYAGKTSSGH